MILTACEIVKNLNKGDIILAPFDQRNLGTISYKFRIGNQISVVDGPLDSQVELKLSFQEIPKCGYILKPGVLHLAQTFEVMGARNFAQQIFALRDVGSAGIFINVSADLGHVGAITHWTLEITTDHEILLYPYQFIGQMIFWQLNGVVTPYNGDYQNMLYSLPSKQWKEF